MLNFTTLFLGMFMVVMWMAGVAVLRSACGISKAPKPGFVGAMALVLFVGGATAVLQFVLSMTLGMSGLGNDAHAVTMLRTLLAVPSFMLVAAMIYKMMLPTTFGRGTAICLVQMLVCFCLLMVFSMVVSSLSPSSWAQMKTMMCLPW